MKKLLSALFLLALCSSLAGASVPDPTFCTVGPLLGNQALPATQVAFLSPGAINGTTITVTVRNLNNVVIPNSVVIITFATGPGNIGICTNAVHTNTTDSNGRAIITLKGGGCLTDDPNACVITASGWPIRTLYNVRSPDNEGHTTSVPNGAVNVQDLGAFGDEFVVGPAACHDYDKMNGCNTQDLGLFGDAFALGTSCSLAP